MKKRIVVSQATLARLSGGEEERVHARLEKLDVEGRVVSSQVGEITVKSINGRDLALGEWSPT